MNDLEMPVPTFGALILAGGQSSRMGTDKAALPFRAGTLLAHMRDTAAQAGAGEVLTGGGPQGDLPDPVPYAGPAASLCALRRYVVGGGRFGRWVVLPIDMPQLGSALLRRLALDESRAAFFEGHPLPLALTVDSTAEAILADVEHRMIDGESISIRHILALLEARALPLASADHPQLVNANTPADWQRILKEQK